MQRRNFLAMCTAITLVMSPVWTDSFKDRYIAQLKAQGFSNLTVTKTWLGRTRITASSKSYSRELIFSTKTGEILRDYSESIDGAANAQGLTNPNSGSQDTGSGTSSSGEGGGSGGGEGDGGGEGEGGDSGSGGGEAALQGQQFEYLTAGLAGDVHFQAYKIDYI